MKIWRYLDLAKFAHMLATRSLYFACSTQMTDPYEGWLPRSHMVAMMGLTDTYLRQMQATCDEALIRKPGLDPAAFDLLLEDARRKLDFSTLLREANLKFGLSCWHINDFESEAMWRLYASVGSGIAIETTEAKLQAALNNKHIIIDRVRYMDFDRDAIEKGHRHYGLFLKRRSFEHERELRATILLDKPGEGTLVPCNLDGLIENVHIAPEAPAFYIESVQYLIDRCDLARKPPVVRSRLFDAPSFT